MSIVVTASSHNPSILHPAFLRSEGIVPAEWEAGEQTISTPVFARVSYPNPVNISLTAEPGKIQFVEESPSSDVSASPLPGIASRYVRALPKVPYTGLGINPVVFVAFDDPVSFVSARFLRERGWRPADPLDGLDVIWVFKAVDARVRLSVATGGRGPRSGDGRKGLVAQANYHFELKDAERVAASATERFGVVRSHFVELVARAVAS